MKKIKVISYFDHSEPEDATGIICASEGENISDAALDSVKEWLQASEEGFEKPEIKSVLNDLYESNNAVCGHYELFVTETFCYT